MCEMKPTKCSTWCVGFTPVSLLCVRSVRLCHLLVSIPILYNFEKWDALHWSHCEDKELILSSKIVPAVNKWDSLTKAICSKVLKTQTVISKRCQSFPKCWSKSQKINIQIVPRDWISVQKCFSINRFSSLHIEQHFLLIPWLFFFNTELLQMQILSGWKNLMERLVW